MREGGDLTYRTAAHEAYIVNELFLETDRPVLMLDPDHSIRMMNPAAIRSLGITNGSRDPASWTRVFEPSAARALLKNLDDARVQMRTIGGQVETADGRSQLTYRAFPVGHGTDRPDSMAIIFDDVTERMERRWLYEAVHDLHELIDSTIGMQRLLDWTAERLHEDLGARGVCIYVRDEGNWSPEHRAGEVDHLGGMTDDEVLSWFPGLLGQERTEDVPEHPRIMPEHHAALPTREVIATPLKFRGEMVGIIMISFERERRPSPSQLEYVRVASRVIPLAMENCHVLADEEMRRDFLKQILDLSPANIAILRYPDMRITLANEGFKRCIGDMVDLHTLLDRMPGEVKCKVSGILDRVHRTGEAHVESEMPIQCPDGTTTHWKVHLIPRSGLTGQEILITMMDITDHVMSRRRIEDLAQRAELQTERLQAVLETLPIAALVIDREGRSFIANDVMTTFVHPVPGNILSGGEAGSGLAALKEMAADALEGERIIGRVVEMETREGGMRTLMGAAGPIVIGGEVVGAVLTFPDVTDQMRAEREAIMSRERMELYIDLLSHDISNLNTGAKGYLELLLMRGGLEGKPLHYVHSSHMLMDDIARLVENVRKLREAETLQRTVVDIDDFLGDIVSMYSSMSSSLATISFHPGGGSTVFGNMLLRDVLDNLVSNAIKHSDGPVDIDISVSRVEVDGRDHVRVDIADTGPGIPDDVKAMLFQRMQRGRTSAPGHGLGLYLARTVVELFDGRIAVGDRVPGDHSQGAKFVVLLPAAGPVTLSGGPGDDTA